MNPPSESNRCPKLPTASVMSNLASHAHNDDGDDSWSNFSNGGFDETVECTPPKKDAKMLMLRFRQKRSIAYSQRSENKTALESNDSPQADGISFGDVTLLSGELPSDVICPPEVPPDLSFTALGKQGNPKSISVHPITLEMAAKYEACMSFSEMSAALSNRTPSSQGKLSHTSLESGALNTVVVPPADEMPKAVTLNVAKAAEEPPTTSLQDTKRSLYTSETMSSLQYNDKAPTVAPSPNATTKWVPQRKSKKLAKVEAGADDSVHILDDLE